MRKLRRDINKLRDMGLVSVEKLDGFLWVSPTPKALYLIEHRRNSNRVRRSMRPEKARAIQLLRCIDIPGYFVWSKDGKNKVAEGVVNGLKGYIDYAESIRVVLVRRELVVGGASTLDELGRLAVDDSDVLVVPYPYAVHVTGDACPEA
uniref:Uncharacterized protein n=1 Tax=Thermococcus prieurii TaxID=1128108 RepID=R4L3W6_9EURY|nr:hypothetical protein [Thermococcus prieurii]AGL12825.1 hypothetical protein [Thermococcus prieurii]